MILAAPLLIPFAEAAGIAIGTLAGIAGLEKLSNKVEEYIEDNPENAQKIFAMIMPEQGLANILKNESDDGEEMSEEELGEITESESGSTKDMVLEELNKKTGNYSDPNATGNYASKRGRIIGRLKREGKIRQDNDPNYDPDKKYKGYTKFYKKKYADGGIMGGNKTYHQVRDQFMPMDSESMGYANGGGVGSMMQPKSKTGKAVNQLQAKAPEGEFLAYINPDEAAMLKRAGGSGEPVNGIPSFRPQDMGNAANQKSSAASTGSSNKSRNTGTSTRHNPHTQSGTSKTSTVSGNTMRSSARDFVQTLNNNRAIAAGQGGPKFESYGGGSRPQGGIFSNISFNPLSLIAGLIGGPFAGLAMRGITGLKGGLKGFNEKMRGINPLTGEANTQEEYEQARFDRQQTNRLDKLYAAKDKGYNSLFGMKTTDFTPGQQSKIDMLEQNYDPTTARNVLTGRDLGLRNTLAANNITNNNMKSELFDPNNIQSLIDNAASKNTQPQGIVFNNPVGGLDQYAREMEALEAARGGQKVSVNELGGTLQDFYTNRNPGTNAKTRFEVIDDNINFNTQPQGLSMMEQYYNNIDNKATGPNIVPDASTLAQQAKTFNTIDALNSLGNTTEKGFFGTGLTDQGKALEAFRNSATNFKNAPANTANTPGAALGFMTDPARAGISQYDSIRENKDFIQNAINQGFLQTEDDYTNQKSLEDFI